MMQQERLLRRYLVHVATGKVMEYLVCSWQHERLLRTLCACKTGKVIEYVVYTRQQERLLSTLCTRGNRKGYWVRCGHDATGKVIEKYIVYTWQQESLLSTLGTHGNRKGYRLIEYVVYTWQQERLLSTLCTRGNRKGYWVHCVHVATGKVIEYVVYTWQQERLLSTLCTLHIPERLFHPSIVGNVLSLGVDTVEVQPLTLHLHRVVRVLLCNRNTFKVTSDKQNQCFESVWIRFFSPIRI